MAKSLLEEVIKERDYALRQLSKAQHQLFLENQKERVAREALRKGEAVNVSKISIQD